MMLMELSFTYRTSAQMLRQRIGELREERVAELTRRKSAD